MPSCPKCLNSYTRRSRKQDSRKFRPSWYESVYRCDRCGHRFLALNPTFSRNWFAGFALLAAAVVVVLWLVFRGPGPEDVWQAASSQPPPPNAALQDQIAYSGFVSIDELKASATAGNPDSQYHLASLLFEKSTANGDASIRASAMQWLGAAAAEGQVLAQREMGRRFMAGQGVVQDFAQAADWYLMAARQGDAKAMYQLGNMAQFGWGVEESLVDAYVWLNLAAARGDAQAEKAKTAVIRLLSPDQVHEAQRRARELDQEIPQMNLAPPGGRSSEAEPGNPDSR